MALMLDRPFRTEEQQLALDGLGAAAPGARVAAPAAAPPASVAPAAAGSLDDVLAGTWRTLGAQRAAACPVCGETMRARAGAHGGACGGCGSRLA